MLCLMKSGTINTKRLQFLRKIIHFIAVISIFHVSLCLANTQEDWIEEYQIKAVYLFNFALFFTWPDYTFKKPSQPFRICILGQNPYGIDLDLVVENETVEGHPVIVQPIYSVYRTQTCQMLFISQSEQSRLANIFPYIKRYPILTVSDIKGFAQQGGMIEFFNTSDNEVRFIIAPEAVNEASLLASANLLEIAKIFYRSR
jgi:hypothetical protein